MRALSADHILRIWERGLDRDACSRSLLLLAAAHPEEEEERLALRTLGARDASIMELRCRTLGPELEGRTLCPACGVQLRFLLDGSKLFPAPIAEESAEISCEVEGIDISFRQPNHSDLGAAAACADLTAARRLLLHRCVASCRREGRPLEREELSEIAISALGEAMLKRDPGAEMRVDLECAACGTNWWVLLEIGDFLWHELAALAPRIIDEVARLARAYGWSEPEILSMSSARRRLYLEAIPK